MYTEDQLALVHEIVPRTLRSLFVLRITLYVVVACLALIKILLSPPSSTFILSIVTDPNTDHEKLKNLIDALNLMFSGLLASVLAVVIATYFIQARIRGHADQETAEFAPTTITT